MLKYLLFALTSHGFKSGFVQLRWTVLNRDGWKSENLELDDAEIETLKNWLEVKVKAPRGSSLLADGHPRAGLGIELADGCLATRHLPWEVRNLPEAGDVRDRKVFTGVRFIFFTDSEFFDRSIMHNSVLGQTSDAQPSSHFQMMQVCASQASLKFQ